uniref:Uncharacterized protein n=1 Tax=Steinernema glaseri TaxID=37863 RepID=A0A1I7YW46_9BILA
MRIPTTDSTTVDTVVVSWQGKVKHRYCAGISCHSSKVSENVSVASILCLSNVNTLKRDESNVPWIPKVDWARSSSFGGAHRFCCGSNRRLSESLQQIQSAASLKRRLDHSRVLIDDYSYSSGRVLTLDSATSTPLPHADHHCFSRRTGSQQVRWKLYAKATKIN